MKKDLTKVPGSISYEYLQVMPKIYDLQNNKDLTASEKREEILIVAMQALNKANTKTATYDRKRNELIGALNDNELIRIMQDTIIHGREFDDGRG